MSVTWVSASDFKTHPSRCLDVARGGKTVVVNDRGRLVARIDQASSAEDANTVLAVLVAAGLVRPAVHLLADDSFNSPPEHPAEQVLKAVPGERRF